MNSWLGSWGKLEQLRESSKADHREYFWAVMALMVSGARLAEILELIRKDVHQVEGVWCFLIEPGSVLLELPELGTS